MIEHSLRHELNDEFHSRPPRSLSEPMRIRHLVFMHDGSSAPLEREHLDKLAANRNWSVIEASESYRMLDRDGACLRWELHTEFSSYTYFEPETVPASNMNPHDADIGQWLDAIPGNLIVALRIDHHAAAAMNPDAAIAQWTASGQQMVASSIVDGRALLMTDFQTHENETRYVLIDNGMTPRQAGRTVQRIWEIETYRILALLGLHSANAIRRWLRTSEEDLASLMDGIGTARNADDEQAVLDKLSQLAAEVEHSLASTAFRFGASRAYFAIVMQRINELREQRAQGFPTLQEFMERRLVPPMNTCNAMATRQEELSARIARNSQLLRTRVEIALERQNQELLRQMNQRTRQQLHIQETVEGLSIVAITYYGSQLVRYIAEGMHAGGAPILPELITAASIPGIAVIVWWALRRTRAPIQKS